jgi:hypothetical protein
MKQSHLRLPQCTVPTDQGEQEDYSNDQKKEQPVSG